MRIRCHLRELRGKRSLRDMQALTGVSAGELSRIERGVQLPADRQVDPIAQAYGAPVETWYPARTLLELEHDRDEDDR